MTTPGGPACITSGTAPPVAQFPRCSDVSLAGLHTYSAALIGDAMGRFGALDSGIAAMWPAARLIGNAFTVWTRAGDNAAIHAALDVAVPGDVLVVNGGGDTTRALIGEMIGIKAKARGIAGFVLDGAARDIDELQALEVPVFARAATPAGPFKDGPYRLLTDIAVGGVAVHPGDAVLADRDGAVIVPAAELDDTLETARQLKEEEAVKRLANGQPWRSRSA